MKKIIFSLVLLIFLNYVSAQEVCEYNGIRQNMGTIIKHPGKNQNIAMSNLFI